MEYFKYGISLIVIAVFCITGITIGFIWNNDVKPKKPHIIFIMADDLVRFLAVFTFNRIIKDKV